MKKIIATTAIAFALTAPAFAENVLSKNLTAEELFALSNEAAAERIVYDTSMGDVTAAEVKFALSNMSAAERMTFMQDDEVSRMAKIEAMRKLTPKNSPAEAAAATN